VGELFRYLLVACVALAVDFGSLIALRELAGWHYLPAAAAAFTLGLFTNYSLSIAWVFTHRMVQSRAFEFAIFAAIGLAGLALTELILFAGTDMLGFDYRLSKVIAVGVVFAWNFGARKWILFRGSEQRFAAQAEAASG
jgi:putative flippase GtrA